MTMSDNVSFFLRQKNLFGSKVCQESNFLARTSVQSDIKYDVHLTFLKGEPARKLAGDRNTNSGKAKYERLAND